MGMWNCRISSESYYIFKILWGPGWEIAPNLLDPWRCNVHGIQGLVWGYIKFVVSSSVESTWVNGPFMNSKCILQLDVSWNIEAVFK